MEWSLTLNIADIALGLSLVFVLELLEVVSFSIGGSVLCFSDIPLYPVTLDSVVKVIVFN